ncbi:MAG: SRPBCC domain-containing protein [Actinoplanes sp.]
MGKDYETHLNATVDATPEQVWDAIATGPGISSWFIGRTEIDNGQVNTTFGDVRMPGGTVTTSEPPHHFAYRSPTAADGRFAAYEYLIEGRDRSATVLRSVTSGFLPGDDWSAEYEAMQYGTELFFHTLVQNLRYFPGRTATPVTAFGPVVTDWPAAWDTLHKALGLDPSPRPGDRTADGGEVFFTNPHTLGIRTPDALHRYIRGFHGPMCVAHEIFAGDADPARWTSFLDTLYR